jgi:four helix bundle protein
MCRDAGRIARFIEKHDRDLAQQLRNAATSVVLNIAEGAGSYAGHRKQRYHTALGSSRTSSRSAPSCAAGSIRLSAR